MKRVQITTKEIWDQIENAKTKVEFDMAREGLLYRIDDQLAESERRIFQLFERRLQKLKRDSGDIAGFCKEFKETLNEELSIKWKDRLNKIYTSVV